MRKLKAGLVLLFSILMSLCLFACTPTEGEGPSTGTSNTVRSARFQSNTASVSITDVEAQDESARDEAFMSAVRTLNVQVTIEGRSDIEVVKGDVLTYDFSGVDWETVGSYTATATLTELEGFDCGDGVALTNSLTINVTHGFGEVGEDGTATCPACNAVMTVEELPEGQAEVVSIAGFHAGPKMSSVGGGDLELLTPFGTVDQNGTASEVHTATAGLLRKGMTITLYGTVQHQLNADGTVTAGTEFYDYPNLGIALRDFDVTTSPFAVSDERYIGGMSVIVRSDGWVLMNGIGDNGTSRGTRLLAGLVGGSDDTKNYGSHTSASNTNLSSLPWAYDNTNRPADTSTWGDWAVYSSGTQANDTTYDEALDVSYQYTFRNDNVIEIIYTIYRDGGATDVLSCYIKVPDEYANASFDTIVHGEYVDMSFTKMEIIEQQKLDTITFTGLDDDAKVSYLEGEVINYADFDGKVKITYTGDSTQLDPDSYSIQVYRGESETPEEDADNWVTLSDTVRLQAGDESFRIMVKSGSTTLYVYKELGDADFISSITANSITEVYGIGNTAALGNVGFASDNAASPTVVIAPVGTAAALASDMAGGTGYVDLRVYGTFTGTPATSGIAQILGSGEGYFDVRVTTGGTTTTAAITGVQDTPIEIDVSGMTAPVYAVSYEITAGGTSYNYIPANTGASVTYTITVSDEIYAEARVGVSTAAPTLVAMNALEAEGEFRGGEAYTSSVSSAGGITTLTLTIEYPAMAVGGASSVMLNVNYDGANNLTTLYYGAPAAGEGVISLPNGGSGYFTAANGNLYFIVVGNTNDLVASEIATGDILVNINGGAGATVTPEIRNIGGSYNADSAAIVFADTDVSGAGFVTGAVALNGTLENTYDYDYGYVITLTMPLATYGVTTTSDFYFEYGLSDDDMHPVHVVIADGVATLSAATLGTTAANIVEGGDCFTSRVDGYPVTVDGVNVFYGNLTTTPAEHQWGSDLGGYFVCSECGAVTKNNGTRWTITPDMLEGVTKTGLTVTMNTSGVTGDWNTVALASGQHNAIITLPNLDPFNMDTQLMTDEEKAIAETLIPSNFWPSGDDFYNGGVWNAFVNTDATPSNFTTVVVEPGEEGGISYYLNGVLVVKYAYDRQCNAVKVDNDGDGTAETEVQMEGTAGDYAQLFLMLVERTGLSIANAGITAADAVVYPDALSATQVEALYGNNTVEGYYPVHVHSYETDTTADNYDICACGAINPAHTADSDRHVAAEDDPETTDWLESNYCKVCGMLLEDHVHEAYPENDPDTAINDTFFCKYCDEVMPSHSEHDFETDQTAENYGFCDCGTMDPNHVHVYENDLCIVCNAVSPEHEHTFVEGACNVCGAKCAHEFVNGTCTLCGGVGSAADVTGVSFDNPVQFNTWWDVPLALEFGETLTISGTQTGAGPANHETVLWEFKEGLTGRMDNFGWIFGAASLNFETSVRTVEITDVNGNAVVFDWATYLAIVSEDASEWTFEFSWTEEGKVDIEITATTSTGEYAGYTYTNVWSIDIVEAFTGTSFNLHLTAEGITNFTVTSCTVVSYPAAE